MSKIQHCGFISLLYSIGDKPLSLWSKHISPDGKVRRVTDETLNGDKVIEITGPHDVPICTNIACPADSMEVLNIKLPILVLIVKNLDSKLKFEFQILDKKRHRRKFTFTTFESTPTVSVSAAQLPLKLEKDWNNLEINFQTLCQDVFGTDYEVLQRIIIYSNCRLRRIYLQDRHYKHDETPVELCQAFFDMYMLKWGIYLVDRSSQTEEIYTGPLQPSDLEYVTNENKELIPIIPKFSIALSNNISKRTGNKFVSCSHMLEKGEIIVVTPNSKSVNELDSKGKTKKNTNPGNDTNSESKNEKPDDRETKATEYPSVYLDDTNVSSPKALFSFPHLEKSKYLQLFKNSPPSKLDKEGNIFSKWPYKVEELNREIKSVPTLNDSILNKLKKIPNDHNRKIEQNILSFPTKQSILEVKKPEFQDQSVRNIKNIINEVQRVREQINKKSYNLKSEVKFEDSSESMIPYFVELEAKPTEKKSKSKLLTNDAIVSDFLKSRFIANKKIFERLRDKGLTMTEVELSIYNSKNRRNCYGQGKIIESFRGSTNKATGIGVIKDLKPNQSLKKGILNNNENSTKLKKELDVILFPYQDSTHKASSTQLFTIPEAIRTEQQTKTTKNASKVRRASVNYLWNNAEDGNDVNKSSKNIQSNQKNSILRRSNSCKENK